MASTDDITIRTLERAASTGDTFAAMRLAGIRERLAAPVVEESHGFGCCGSCCAPRSYGAKYVKGMTVTAISAAIRADVKAALKAGELPAGVKVSVRKRDHASITVEVQALPAGFLIHQAAPANDRYGRTQVRTEAAQTLLDRLESIAKAYRYDGSRSEVDYFDTNYYASASFSWELERAERLAKEAD